MRDDFKRKLPSLRDKFKYFYPSMRDFSRLLSSFMGGKESIEEYIVTRKNKIETLCEQTLSLYGDYMDENELNYVDGVLNSYFIQNPLTPMKFDIPKEVQPFYPNNQKEIGESIWQIFNIGKHMS